MVPSRWQATPRTPDIEAKFERRRFERAAVTVGQTVSAGDLLEELGNSGNTDAPHLHFHVMDGPGPLASDGLLYQFDSLQLVGQASDDAIDPMFRSGANADKPPASDWVHVG